MPPLAPPGAGRAAKPGEGFRARGADRHFTLTVDFVTAATGGKQRLSLAPEEWLDVTIPAGFEDGQVLRLRGKGGPGFGGGPAGDALIEVHVAPHPLFRRDGDNVLLDLPVSVAEAVLGARVSVPTVAGPGDNDDTQGIGFGTAAAPARQGDPASRKTRRPDRDAEGRHRPPGQPGAGGIPRKMGAGAPLRPTPRDAVSMIAFDELLMRFQGLDHGELRRWIENGWILPEQRDETWIFHEVDVARVELIFEIRHEFAVDEEAMPARPRSPRPGL